MLGLCITDGCEERALLGSPYAPSSLAQDFASLPQRPFINEHESQILERGTVAMMPLYASITGSCVLKQCEVKPREDRPEYAGAVYLFGLAPSLRNEGALLNYVARFGQLQGIKLRGRHREEASVTFACHEGAEACLRHFSAEGKGAVSRAAFFYDDTPYKARGWVSATHASNAGPRRHGLAAPSNTRTQRPPCWLKRLVCAHAVYF